VTDFKDLVEKAQAGDKNAYGTIYSELYTPVYKYVYIRTRNKELSEDITSDVFLRFLSSLHLYTTQKDTPLSYLFTIARNLLINNGKKKKADLFEEGMEENVRDESASALDKNIFKEEISQVMEILSKIQDDQREVIELKFLSELSTKEVSLLLKKSEANIRQLESRGLKKMREILQSYE
jgi:RNA polymerase sigma-70 factor, ECF subfamily